MFHLKSLTGILYFFLTNNRKQQGERCLKILVSNFNICNFKFNVGWDGSMWCNTAFQTKFGWIFNKRDRGKKIKKERKEASHYPTSLLLNAKNDYL